MREFCVDVLKGYKKPTPKRSIPAPRIVHPVVKPRLSSASRPVKGLITVTGVIAALSSATYYSRHDSITKFTRALLGERSLLYLGLPGGFPAGFLAASTLTALLAAAAANQLSKITNIPSGFTRFPAHKPSTKPRWTHVPAKEITFMNPKTYQALPLICKEDLAPGVLRLVFALPTPNSTLGLPTGQHVSIRAVIDGRPVTRSYTPTSNDSDKGILERVVRCYPDGLLTSRYLAHLRPGSDRVEFRDPKGAMHYRPGWAKKIGMVAGGTGITPMYQVIRAICENERDQTEVSLVYANKAEGDMLLRGELGELAARYPEKLRLWYLLDVTPDGWGYGAGYVTKEVLREKMPEPREGGKVMVCGPPGMVHAAKKLLVEVGFRAPGAMASMEDDVFVF